MGQHIQSCKDERNKGLRSGLGNSRVTLDLLGQVEVRDYCPPVHLASHPVKLASKKYPMPQRDKLTDWSEAQFPLLQVGLLGLTASGTYWGNGTISEQRCKVEKMLSPQERPEQVWW